MSTLAHFTLAQYELMVEAGAFDGKYHQRVEFIRGEIREMTPFGPKHAWAVDWLNAWSFENTSRQEVIIRIQSSARIPNLERAPEPDVLWLAKRDYSSRHPEPADILLLIEVAYSSVAYDIGEKARLTHYRLQQDATDSHHLGSIYLQQQAESRYQGVTLSSGIKWARTDYNALFTGEGADLFELVVLEMNRINNIVYDSVTFLLVVDILEDRDVIEEFVCGHILIGAEFLRKVSDKSLKLLAFFLEIDLVDLDCSHRLVQDTADDAHNSRFSGAVRAQQSEHAAFDLK